MRAYIYTCMHACVPTFVFSLHVRCTMLHALHLCMSVRDELTNDPYAPCVAARIEASTCASELEEPETIASTTATVATSNMPPAAVMPERRSSLERTKTLQPSGDAAASAAVNAHVRKLPTNDIHADLQNRIYVSHFKRPLGVLVELSKKFLMSEEEVELCGIGFTVTTCVMIAEILQDFGHVVICSTLLCVVCSCTALAHSRNPNRNAN